MPIGKYYDEAKPDCFAHRHMKPAEYGLYDYARSVTRRSPHILDFDGRAVARQFANTGKDAIYTHQKRLVAKGWFQEIKAPTRNMKTGNYDGGKYRVLSHDEWVEKNPTRAKKECASLEIQTG